MPPPRRKRLRNVVVGLGVILSLALIAFWFVVPSYVDRSRNGVLRPPPYAASERARAVHATLRVADLHADTLLWDRDLLVRATRGHVDVPRLLDGNVAIQAFTVVTKTPRGMNIDSNTGDTDNITLLALAERWPIASWTSLLQRALYQAGRLEEAARRSQGRLVVLRTKADLAGFLNNRQASGTVAAFLGLEGAHALEGNPAALDRLHEAGFRMIGIAHFFDNEMGGSAHGATRGGLTDAGRQLVSRIENLHMMVDLAHASAATIDDVLKISRGPVVVSHTGVRGTCDNARNLSDDHLRGIARTGGLVGIGYWQTATCGTDAAAIARSIRYAADLIGVGHVALGSDFDGAVATPFDTTGLAQITDALLQAGFSEPEIRQVMGENVIRLLGTILR